METDDQAAGAINLHLDVRVPEHVVGVDDDTDPTVEHTGEVDRLAQRDDHRSLTDHHRMKRLDPQRHAVLHRVGKNGFDAFFDHSTRSREITIRSGPAHHHEHGRSELGRLFDRSTVVVDACRTLSCSRSREEAAAAQPRTSTDLAAMRAAAPAPSWSLHTPTAPMPARAQPSSASSSDHPSTVLRLRLSLL